jgi:two-component system sensor histidine kinase MprB
MDASHELRTPLTSLRTNLEVLQRTPDMGDDDRRELMADLEFEVTELSHMVGELVGLATDAEADDDSVETFALAELVEELAERTRRRTDRVVLVDADHAGTVTAGRAGVERAVLNLLDNGHKFSPPDAPLEVRVGPNEVEVRDHGPGVADEDKPMVFDRFFRSTSARSEPGSGLGLSIVDQVARRHGGETWVRDAEGGGAVVGFALGPLQAAADAGMAGA